MKQKEQKEPKELKESKITKPRVNNLSEKDVFKMKLGGKIKEKWLAGKTIRAVIINSRKRIVTNTAVVNNNKIKVGKHMYLIEPDMVFFHKNVAYSFYTERNPRPLNPSFQAPEYDSETMKKLMDMKFIQDIASGSALKETSIVLILTGINLLGTAFLISKFMGWF